jgi:hypothetical protein
MNDESFHLVRLSGETTVHILIGGDSAAGEDPDWDVAMCGMSLGIDRHWAAFAALEHGMTVSDMCIECFKSFGAGLEAVR